MSVVNLPLVQIREFQTQELFPLRTVSPGTYRVPLQIQGNSLLSSLLVTAVERDATIKVNYFQTTTGDESAERSELTGHVIRTAGTNSADTIIVARVHLKPFCEVVISGGNVTFGLMITMVSAFASDIESSLFKDTYPVSGTERGIPLMTIDDQSGQFRFMRSKGGNLIMRQESLGSELHLVHSDRLEVNQRKLSLAHQLIGKAFRLSQLTCVSSSDYHIIVRANGSLFAAVRTSKEQPVVHLECKPLPITPTGALMTIEAQRHSGDGDGILELFVRGYEFFNDDEATMASMTKVVYNKSGALILPFKAVAWLNDNSVGLADADGLGLDDFAGVTQDGIAHLGYGIIHKLGEVPNALIGFGAIAGQPVFLGSNAGELTLTPPAAGTIFRIGRAEPPSGTHQGEATSLFIDPQIISEA